MAYSCAFLRPNTDTKSIDRLTRPVTTSQNQLHHQGRGNVVQAERLAFPGNGFEPTKFRSLFSCASQAIDGDSKQSWSAQIETLQSNEGIEYDRLLLARFEEMRLKSP